MQTTVQSGREQILDVLVPQRQEQLVGVPKIVFQDRVWQRTIEQFADSPDVVDELVFKDFHQDGVQQSFVKQNIEKSRCSRNADDLSSLEKCRRWCLKQNPPRDCRADRRLASS